jgi:hypothetical protein
MSMKTVNVCSLSGITNHTVVVYFVFIAQDSLKSAPPNLLILFNETFTILLQ